MPHIPGCSSAEIFQIIGEFKNARCSPCCDFRGSLTEVSNVRQGARQEEEHLPCAQELPVLIYRQQSSVTVKTHKLIRVCMHISHFFHIHTKDVQKDTSVGLHNMILMHFKARCTKQVWWPTLVILALGRQMSSF